MNAIATPTSSGDAELTAAQFATISSLVEARSGIRLPSSKLALVKARLGKRLRALGLASYGRYVERIVADADGEETSAMLDALTTNLTHFFREPRHFELLRRRVFPALAAGRRATRRIRIWSAGCSSGEEPYSIAIILREAEALLAGWDIGILATDLSRRMLAVAREGRYGANQLREMPTPWIEKYFKMTAAERTFAIPGRVRWRRAGAGLSCQVRESLRRMVHFARLNLMDPWPMKGPFDVVFCRNVMIYFDKPTQQQLIDRFWRILAPGGTLFTGHAESLGNLGRRFRGVEPAVYEKIP